MSEPASKLDESPSSVRSPDDRLSEERARISGIREKAREARREHRRHLELSMRFRIPAEDGDETVHARARNISVGGMFIETDQPLPFGAEVTVEIALPDLPELARIACTVRWTSAEGMGVQFGVMGARETHGLVKLLEP